jgi:putative MATE family efflux protein
MTTKLTNNYLISKSFKSYILVSILGLISATLGMVIDGLFIGNYIGNEGMAAYGIASPFFIFLAAVATIFANGGTILSSNYIGREEKEKVNISFTITCFIALITSLVIMILSPFYVDILSVLLGAKGGIINLTSDYIFGFTLGTASLVFSQVLFSYTRLDNSPNLGLISVGIATIVNLILDYLFVAVFNFGMFGIGIATTISYSFAIVVLLTHFFSKKNNLKISKFHNFEEGIKMLRIGLPSALNRVFTMGRTIVTNNLAILVGGTIVMGALSVQSSVNQLLSSVAMGIGMTTMLLGGVFFGEEDKRSLKDLLSISLKWGSIIIIILSVLVIIFSPYIVSAYGKDPNVLPVAIHSLRLFALSLPPSLIAVVLLNFYSSINNTTMANYIAFAHSFLFISLFACILTPFIGDNGIWLCFVLGEVFTLIGLLFVIKFKSGKWPRSIDDLLMLDSDFEDNIKDSFEISLKNDMNHVMELSTKVQSFINKYPNEEDKLLKVSLCVEEMVGNIVKHGFDSSKTHYIDIRIILVGEDVVFRIRDDGKPFNPIEYGNDNSENTLGIALIRKIAKNMEYRSTIGLNNLTITL